MRRHLLAIRINWHIVLLVWHQSQQAYHKRRERELTARLADLCGRRQRGKA